MNCPNACIAVFAKAPVPGLVKTRLIPALGATAACDLHDYLLRRTLRTVQRNPLCNVELWVDQLPEHPAFADFSGPVHLQQGPGLGERLSSAARQLLLRYSRIVLIGTDCPGIDRAYLTHALELLQTSDAVVGPATDGGYVLLGLRCWHAALFHDIDWGSSRVMQQTVERIAAVKMSIRFLPPLGDVDRPEDLCLLPHECEQVQVSRSGR